MAIVFTKTGHTKQSSLLAVIMANPIVKLARGST